MFRSLFGKLKFRIDRLVNPPIDAYTTHLPVLIGLASARPVRRVLEFGCGPFSTLTFLDRSLFPDLVALDSYETDPVWRDMVVKQSGNDPRLQLKVVPAPMAETIRTTNFEPYDLVFVDDSVTVEERAASVRTAANVSFTHPWLIAHDLENPAYRAVVPDRVQRQEFNAFTPFTWVMWNGGDQPQAKLKRISELIHANHRIRPHRKAKWKSVFQNAN